MNRKNFTVSVTFYILGIIIVGIAVMIGLFTLLSVNATEKLMEKTIEAKVQFAAAQFHTLGEIPISTVRVIADNAAVLRKLDEPRQSTLEYYRNILSDNDDIYAVWSCWVNNSFDGLDEPGSDRIYDNARGEFAPYVCKDGEGTEIRALDFDDSHDYFYGPKKKGDVYITEPFRSETSSGKVTKIYSVGLPLYEEDKLIAVIGADIKMAVLEESFISTEFFDNTYSLAISPGGVIASSQLGHSEMFDYNNSWLDVIGEDIQKTIYNGGVIREKIYSRDVNDDVFFYSTGVPLGNSKQNWLICAVVPYSSIVIASVNPVILPISFSILITVVLISVLRLSVRRKLRELIAAADSLELLVAGKADKIKAVAVNDDGDGSKLNEFDILKKSLYALVAKEQKKITPNNFELIRRLRGEEPSHGTELDALEKSAHQSLSAVSEGVGGDHEEAKASEVAPYNKNGLEE